MPVTRVAAAILAAGKATRFGAGDSSKAVAMLGGLPLVRHVARKALASRAAPVLVVTGHAAGAVAGALDGLPVTVAHNPDFTDGFASSLKTAVAALPAVDGLLVLLADMPLVRVETLDALIAAFAEGSHEAVVPRYRGRSGNPVLLGRRLFPDLATLDGDAGARTILSQAGRRVFACDVDDPGIFTDVDTRDALRAISGAPEG